MLLDTYAWVEFFNGTKKGETVKRVLREETCFTSAISIAELSYWAERKGFRIKDVMAKVGQYSSVLSLDENILELAGALKVFKRETEKSFGLIDSIILAHAKLLGLKVVTGDRHFEKENAVML